MPVKGGETAMRKNALTLKLVVQGGGTVMVPAGKIPVLIGPDIAIAIDDRQWMEVLAMAVNFLNSGCPSVTIWSPMLERLEPDQKEKAVQETREKIKDLLPDDPFAFLVDPINRWSTEPDRYKGTLSIRRRTDE